jgi:hypothetical protein
VIREVRYDSSVEEFLRTSPHAEEVRLVVATLVRGQVPAEAVVDLDDQGTSLCPLEHGRHLWWHYVGTGRDVLVIDGVSDD